MHRLTYYRLLDKAIAAQERVIALDLYWLRTRSRTRGDDLVGTFARLSLWADRIMGPDGIREGPRVEGEPGRAPALGQAEALARRPHPLTD